MATDAFATRREGSKLEATLSYLRKLRIYIRDDDAVCVPVKAGSIACFWSLTPHMTGPNSSDGVRKVRERRRKDKKRQEKTQRGAATLGLGPTVGYERGSFAKTGSGQT